MHHKKISNLLSQCLVPIAKILTFKLWFGKKPTYLGLKGNSASKIEPDASAHVTREEQQEN